MALSAYHVAYQIVRDYDLHVRVAASARQESEVVGAPLDDPELWANEHAWDYGTNSDWVDVVLYAIETGNTAWGKDPTVVTDQAILSYVQAVMTPPGEG